jgi:wobble nucleotide-excising tRNase
VADGLSYALNESCPFCGGSLFDNTIFSAFKEYFNQAYAYLKQDIADTIHQFEKTVMPSDSATQIENALHTNTGHKNFRVAS